MNTLGDTGRVVTGVRNDTYTKLTRVEHAGRSANIESGETTHHFDGLDVNGI
jgi:hypothetical protein